MDGKESDENRKKESEDNNEGIREELEKDKKLSKTNLKELINPVVSTPPRRTAEFVYAASPSRPRPVPRPPAPPTYYSNAFPGQFGHPMGGGMPMMYFQNPIMDFTYWAPYPENVPAGIPPGLAHLLAVDTILVMQQVNMMELFISRDQTCSFMVLNADGLCIFYAYETSYPLQRYCCGDNRPLQIHVMDMYQNEIIYMSKKCSCSKCPCCCQCCCLTAMEVYSMPLTPIGAIIGHSKPGHVVLDIVDVDENVLFHVHQQTGIICIYCLFSSEFMVTTPDDFETEIGLIKKQWGGSFREYLSSADVFTVNFPRDLDVKIKALFIAAMFLINYMYYES